LETQLAGYPPGLIHFRIPQGKKKSPVHGRIVTCESAKVSWKQELETGSALLYCSVEFGERLKAEA